MFPALFRFFESRVRSTAPPPTGAPPAGLLAFYWHFIRQARVLFLGMLLSCLLVALSDTVTPVLIGRLVALMTATDRTAALQGAAPDLMAMVLFLLVLRPAILLFDSLVRNNAVMPGVTTLIRWQTTGTWCARAGRSSRTTSPDASPTASMHTATRCAKARSRASGRSGTSSSMV
jgi:hypothetical protein